MTSALSMGLRQSALLIVDVLPWLLFGAAIASALKTRVGRFADSLLCVSSARVSIPIAAAAGAASPLCTLGSLPIVTSLLSKGLNRAAALAFLASSSIVTPQISLLTAAFLGPRFALLQALGGIMAGVAAGWIAELSATRHAAIFRVLEEATVEPIKGGAKGFMSQMIGQLEYGLFWLVVAVTVSQCALALADASGIRDLTARLPALGNGRGRTALASLAGTLVSGPAYSCGGAVLPILAALRNLGVDESFVMAFLICGPATRIRSAAALGKILTKRGLAYYFLFIAAFSICWSMVVSLTFG